MDKTRDNGWLVLTLFFCSGATALVYEVVWSKYLSQMFGSTIYAQTVVLAVFMGGLALGNRLFGGRTITMTRPLRSYGYVELLIGLYAFFFESLYGVADAIFVSVGASVIEHRWLLLSIKGLLSIALLIVPTVLMGGTLPMLVAWLQKSSIEAGRRSARFYSVNSLGAVFGAGVAGFYMVQNWGLVATLQATALINMVIAAIAIGVGRHEVEPTQASASTESSQPTAPVRWAAGLVAATGAISMGLEVLASRSLSLIFGSSLQSFAIVLMAFILGIGLGSACIASPRLRRWQSEKMVACLLLAAGAWVGLLVFNIETLVNVYRYARSGLAPSSMGYYFHQFMTALLSLVVLGFPAALIGAVLPLLIRSLASSASALGVEVGRLLTWNTLGAVFGVLLTGFVLMPLAGLRGAFGALALCLVVISLITAWRHSMRWLSAVGGTAAIAAIVLFALTGEGWRHTLGSGIFRAREIEVDTKYLDQRKQRYELVFYEDAPDATVSVERLKTNPDSVVLRVNGKPDASSDGDMSSQLLVAHLPLLARPDSQDVFLLGMGSGCTGGAVLAHPIKNLTIAENCEPVIRATSFFEKWNRGVTKDPRAKIQLEDARTLLKLSPSTYDVIICEPSNPWVVGVGSVFSQEFYRLAASRLRDGGVMAQWFHVYEVSDPLVTMVLRTFNSVFPHVEIWDTSGGDLVMLGAMKPWASSPATWSKGFNHELVTQDMKRIGFKSPSDLLARRVASQRTAYAIAGNGPIQRDKFPVLEYAAPRSFYLGLGSQLVMRFDERSVQRELAPVESQTLLPQLADDQIKEIFKYASVNAELRSYVSWRTNPDPAATDAAEPAGLRSMACLFRPTGRKRVPYVAPSDAAEDQKKAFAAMALFDGDRAQQLQGLDQMEALLRERKADAKWSAANCASQAAKISLVYQQFERTKMFLGLGLQAEPEDLQLNYLARIVEREHPSGANLSAAK